MKRIVALGAAILLGLSVSSDATETVASSGAPDAGPSLQSPAQSRRPTDDIQDSHITIEGMAQSATNVGRTFNGTDTLPEFSHWKTPHPPC